MWAASISSVDSLPQPGKQFRQGLTLAGEDKEQMAVRHPGTGCELAEADLVAALAHERQDVCGGSLADRDVTDMGREPGEFGTRH